ncbi:MAG: hypothetical protein WDN25_22850 [Acetobacteraceae bacterium]
MDVLDLLGDAGRIILRIFVVIAPLLAWQLVAIRVRPWRRRDGGLADPTVMAGMMTGFGILAVSLPPEVLTWNAIVSVGGAWDLGLWQFMDVARETVLGGPGALAAALMHGDAQRDLQAWLALAMTLWLVRVGAVWLSGPLGWAGPLLAGEVVTFLASVFGTVYLGPLVLWSINRLNFWLLLIAVLLIQDYRYDEPPLFGRLVGAVNGVRNRPRRVGAEGVPVPDPD